jgi:2,4-didehydro-3-deoxy-L-rhamnonate hydrolase
MSNCAVNIVRYRQGGAERFGVREGSGVRPIDLPARTTGELLSAGHEAIRCAAATSSAVAMADIELLSPITRNQQFICQGVNYESHLRESGLRREDLPFNTIFTKASSCIVPPNAAIVRPAHVALLDYEAELGLVLGRDIDGPVDVTEADWHRYVVALVIVNDVSARDVQLPQGQFYKGKSYRSFGPVGPHLTLVDDVVRSRFAQLRVRLDVNGQLRQDFLAGEMIFKPWHTLTELSRVQDLQAGDLISTGTAAGCAARSPGRWHQTLAKVLLSERRKWAIFRERGAGNPLYLKPADRVRTRVGSDDGTIDLGEQLNLVVAEQTQQAGAA